MSKKGKSIGICCAALFLVLLGFTALYQRQRREQEPISATSYKLNTVIKVDIYDSSDRSLLDGVMEVCDQYEALFSRTLDSSEIYKLNHNALPKEDGFALLSPDAASLISKGLDYCRLSQGAFDIAIEPVSSLWDFTSQEKRVPSPEEIQEALPLVHYQDLELKENSLRFKKEGMGLDLGAIAKGYIADKMKEYLQSQGVESAVINLGGNVLCLGSRPDGSPFRIGIQKPFADRSETVSVIEISDKSVVSSGIYERFFEKDGTFYHHLLNPSTGYPYENNLVSVTVISEKSVDGDGLSTSCFALGLEKGMELINSLPGVSAVFITDDYVLHYSEDFEKEIPILES